MAETSANFGVAAFAEEDVEDVGRRRPDLDLSGYAADQLVPLALETVRRLGIAE